MALPAPANFLVQQGNGEVLLTWSQVQGLDATPNGGYTIERSDDGGVTYGNLAGVPPTQLYYVDTGMAENVQYFYRMLAYTAGASILSPYTTPQSVVSVETGAMSLGQLRFLAQCRADRLNSNFVTKTEWNQYINQSAFELRDLLVTTYEDYFLAEPFRFITDGTTTAYSLPDGTVNVPDMLGAAGAPYGKLMGVDCGLDNSNNAQVTLGKFDFIRRNDYVFPNISSTYMGVFNLKYRVMGNKIKFIPTPSAGQIITLWYIPRMNVLLSDSDVLDGISGWTEYVIVDAARKALIKEESYEQAQALTMELQMLKKRIEEAASNRDAGAPDTISNTRNSWGFGGGPNGNGNFGGY